MGVRHETDLLGAAVSPLVAGAVAGAATPRRVLGAFATCVYVELGAHHRVLALLASDAVHLPIGLRLAEPASALDWGVDAGDQVVVGEGRVVLPSHAIVAARLARPSRVRAARTLPTTVVVERLPHPGVLGELTLDLTAAALAGRPVEQAVRGLVGAGHGLTPSGDDALCGVLLALGSVDHPDAAKALATVRAQVLPALGRTTSLSAALVVAAASGYAVPDVVRLLALSDPKADRTAYGLVLDRVLAIGHTSGRDLLSGVSGALAALVRSLPVRPPTPPSEGAHRA